MTELIPDIRDIEGVPIKCDFCRRNDADFRFGEVGKRICTGCLDALRSGPPVKCSAEPVNDKGTKQKFINIIRLSGKLHCCPDLHDTKDEADKALSEALGKYVTPHLKFVTQPIQIELPDEEEVKG